MVACRTLGPPSSGSSARSPEIRFLAKSGGECAGSFGAGGTALWGILAGAESGEGAGAVTLFARQLVKEKAEREVGYGMKR